MHDLKMNQYQKRQCRKFQKHTQGCSLSVLSMELNQTPWSIISLQTDGEELLAEAREYLSRKLTKIRCQLRLQISSCKIQICAQIEGDFDLQRKFKWIGTCESKNFA